MSGVAANSSCNLLERGDCGVLLAGRGTHAQPMMAAYFLKPPNRVMPSLLDAAYLRWAAWC